MRTSNFRGQDTQGLGSSAVKKKQERAASVKSTRKGVGRKHKVFRLCIGGRRPNAGTHTGARTTRRASEKDKSCGGYRRMRTVNKEGSGGEGSGAGGDERIGVVTA